MISIAVCDDNEITAQEISEKVKQCCPIEAEVSVFYHIKDILFLFIMKTSCLILSLWTSNLMFPLELRHQNRLTPGIQTVRLYILQIIQTFYLCLWDITYLLYFKERYRYLSFNRIKKGHTADSKDKSVLFDYPIKAAAYSYCTK